MRFLSRNSVAKKGFNLSNFDGRDVLTVAPQIRSVSSAQVSCVAAAGISRVRERFPGCRISRAFPCRAISGGLATISPRYGHWQDKLGKLMDRDVEANRARDFA